MPRFRVVHGSHSELVQGSPTRYPQGSEFDSEFDLDKIFGEKFVRLADSPKSDEPKAKAKAEKGDK